MTLRHTFIALSLIWGSAYYSKAEELIPQLKGIVIIADAKSTKAAGRPGITGALVEGLDFLSNEKVEAQLKDYLGQPLSKKGLTSLQQELIKLCRAEDRPVVDVAVPEQEIVDGVIQIIIISAKIGAIVVENDGDKNISDDEVLKAFDLKAGDAISASKIDSAANWFDRNPFRKADISYKRGAPGMSDVILSIDDEKQWKLYSTIENTGTQALGKNQFAAGAAWTMPYDRDQIISYHYRTDSHASKLKSHAIGYQYFLPTKHYLDLIGYYSDTSAAVDHLFPGMSQKGESWLGSFRYSIPLSQTPSYKPEIQFGFEFKRTDSNLLYGGKNVFAMPTETLQFVTTYKAWTKDRYGVGAYNIDAVWSPGELTGYNEDLDFSRSSRKNSTADYVYYRAAWERNTPLPGGLNWVAQLTGQYSANKLPPAEQMGLGGYTSVRGYDERYINGDSGIVVRNELYLPKWKPFSESESLRVLGFFDYGTIRLSNYEGGDEGLEDAGENFNIASYGWGIRYKFQENLSFRFDHGFQLSEQDRTGSNSMAHFSLTYTF